MVDKEEDRVSSPLVVTAADREKTCNLLSTLIDHTLHPFIRIRSVAAVNRHICSLELDPRPHMSHRRMVTDDHVPLVKFFILESFSQNPQPRHLVTHPRNHMYLRLHTLNPHSPQLM
jgi:hypothetical protein